MTAFIFDPSRVDELLTKLPALAGALPARNTEGTSSSFNGWQKTDRELYRLLANPHYRHLIEALDAIENVLAAGCDLSELLSTPRHAQFSAHLSEVWVADDFLTRGFDVSRPKRTHARSADLVAVGSALDATIEVYSPRVWQALDDWTLELQDAVKNLDEPYDFEIEIAIHAYSGLLWHESCPRSVPESEMALLEFVRDPAARVHTRRRPTSAQAERKCAVCS